ncbi:PilN domain-containing protein [Egicoccus sp. AB-alg2]|uniref:PilN domain-containing protein n=1 Tax=Egicoccus sp. AB-alg2 TaxID=3242693 RepID=UPI00359D0EE0
MSVRVNLLPQVTREQARAAKQRRILAASGLGLLVAVGGVHWWGTGQLRDAEDRLAAAELRTAELQGEVAQMSEYRELEELGMKANASLTEAMAGEVSLAWILSDLASVMPADAQLETITINMPRPDPAAETTSVGSFTITGKTVETHAPGVEAILHELGKVAIFRNLYFNSSSLDDEEGTEVATFSVDGELAPFAKTGRYAEGLPEGLR